jgi:hypothetical protein
MPDEKAESCGISFDPLLMAGGTEPTNDPVFLFRSLAYTVSCAR